MKKSTVLCVYLAVIFISCKNKSTAPDVSGIKLSLFVERFDKDFFSTDSNAMISALPALQSKYPTFVPIFVNYILGLGPIRPDNPAAFEGSKHFLHLTTILKTHFVL